MYSIWKQSKQIQTYLIWHVKQNVQMIHWSRGHREQTFVQWLWHVRSLHVQAFPHSSLIYLSAQIQLIMKAEPPGILRYYQPEKATTSESDKSKVAEKCSNKEQPQNPDEEMTQQDATEAAAKSEVGSKSVQVNSQKKDSKRRRSSDKSTDLK